MSDLPAVAKARSAQERLNELLNTAEPSLTDDEVALCHLIGADLQAIIDSRGVAEVESK